MSQWSTAIRDAWANQIEATIGAAPIIEFFAVGGSPPANCAAADTGTKLAAGTLPSDYLTVSSGGAVTKNGVWAFTGLPAAGTGTNIDFYRIKNAAGTVCHHQGSVTITGGGGVMTVDNTNVSNGQNGTVGTWSTTMGGA
jgi:hypothetical protein